MNRSNLHGYQVTATNKVIDNPYFALLMAMGLGKTIATLTAIYKLMYEELDIMTALIIAPKRVAENVWSDECQKWEHTKGLKISIVAGTESQRKAALLVKADVYTISRDNVVWLCGQYGGLELPFDMLVVDESSSFKNPKSLRFRALRKVQPSFKRVVLLTGTPSPNGLIDIWSQIYLLDRGERLGKFISHFREDYFKPGKRNGAIVYNYNIQKDGKDRIYDKISDICMSMKAEDYINMPELILNDIAIKFPPALQAQYDEFEKSQILELFDVDSEISAVNAAALSNKLLQFSNGAIYDEDKNYHVVHDLKLDAVEEIIEAAAGKPVLIAWTYRHDLYRLQERFKKYKPRTIETGQDIKDWNAGKIQVLLMHPASGGHGLNLQYGGSLIVWFGQTWSLELYQQLNARLNRQGQEQSVIINRLIAHKTVDQDVVKSLESKDSTQEGLMQAMKAKIEKYLK